MSEWRPIETCTLEDEPVLTIRAGTKIPWVASRDEDGWTSFNMIYETHMAKYGLDRTFAPTHWMPLPPSPPAIAMETGTAIDSEAGVVAKP